MSRERRGDWIWFWINHRESIDRSMDYRRDDDVVRARARRWAHALLGTESPRARAMRRMTYERARADVSGERASWSSDRRELARAVSMDVERLPVIEGDGRGRDVESIEALMRVLIVHGEKSARRGYRQGMHEVAAMVFDVARDGRGGRASTSSASPTVGFTEEEIESATEDDVLFLEHDAYGMFEAFMGDVEGGVSDSAGDRKRLRLATYYEDASTPSSPINAAFRRIEKALVYIDAALAQKLAALEVEPQLYLLRWLRLGFGREFHHEDVMILWDAFMDAIANGTRGGAEDFSSRDVYEGVAVSVLLSMRDDILSMHDFGSVMSRLQSVPPGIQVRHLIARAKAMAATSLLDTTNDSLATSVATSAARGKDRLVVPRLRSKSRGDAEAPAESSVDDEDKKRAVKDTWASEPLKPAIEKNVSAAPGPSALPPFVDGFEKVTLTVPRPVFAMTKSNDAEDVDPFTTSMFAAPKKTAGQLLRDTSLKIDAALAAKSRESSPDAAARARADAIRHLTLALASLKRASSLGDASALDAAVQTQAVLNTCESPSP